MDDRWCFVCGPENPIGLRTTWTLDAVGRVRARFRPAREHQGWKGIVHGGILASLLDEAMAQRMRLAGKPTMTAKLSIRYVLPAPTAKTLVAEAWVVSERRRVAHLEAIVHAGDGRPFARAEGTCMRINGGGEE
jgi:uncharacterized protein (TIGR00369 family)